MLFMMKKKSIIQWRVCTYRLLYMRRRYLLYMREHNVEEERVVTQMMTIHVRENSACKEMHVYEIREATHSRKAKEMVRISREVIEDKRMNELEKNI